MDVWYNVPNKQTDKTEGLSENRRDKIMKQRKITVICSVILIFSLLFPSVVMAENDVSELTDITITGFDIVSTTGNTEQSTIKVDKWYRIRMKWNASEYGNTLREGDYFMITLPDEMIFPTNASACDFDMLSPDGMTVAHAHVNSNGKEGGGTVKVTFTDYVNDRFNVAGTLFLEFYLSQEFANLNEPNTFTIVAGTTEETITIPVLPNTPSLINPNEVLSKWASKGNSTDEYVRWEARINFARMDLNNLIIRDRIYAADGDLKGIRFIPEMFELVEKEFDEYGYTVSTGRRYKYDDLKDKLTFNDDMTEFTLDVGDVGAQSFFLFYYTTYVPGVKLMNRMDGSADAGEAAAIAEYSGSHSGGTGDGDNVFNFSILKKDSENGALLSGAVFTVVRLSDNETFTLTTDENGRAGMTIDVMGEYKVVEITAPAGYVIDTSEHTFTATEGGSYTLTVENDPVKTQISVKKIWEGPVQDSTTFYLYNGDVYTGRSLTVSASTDWYGTFTDLPVYDAETGMEIVYNIEEEYHENYSQLITGDMYTGFTAVNKYIERIDIPVKKVWVGPAANEITAQLTADGTVIETFTLNSSNNWETVFRGLLKYDETDGHEIVYGVTETDADGGVYSTEYSGSALEGFVITNINTEKIDIPVKKVWVGPAAASVTVVLLKDDEPVGYAVLDPDTDWSHTFTGLDVYNSETGEAYLYDVKEVGGSGDYMTIYDGDATVGFMITNVNIEQLNIPVKKVWIGIEGGPVVINLYADDILEASATLDTATGWEYTFASLPKYDPTDGHEIVYTVDENYLPGYTSGITGSAAEGFTVTNRSTEKLDIPLKKIWIGTPADSITVTLLADGEPLVTVTLTEWEYVFRDLPKYDQADGHKILYTLDEFRQPGYVSTISGSAEEGFTLTNRISGFTSVSVIKVWTGPSTDKISVSLLNGDEVVSTVLITEEDGWRYVFDGLDKYDADGNEITYSVRENECEGYICEITGTAENEFTLTNVNDEKTRISVEKKWIGKELERIEIILYADGNNITSVTLGKGTNRVHVFEDLPVYDHTDGHAISYTVDEILPDGYTKEITGTAKTGFVITNTEITPPPTEEPPQTADARIGFCVALLLMSGVAIPVLKRKHVVS